MSQATPTIDLKRIPEHVAIIMDGNGRWATARGLDRSQGHVAGVTAVRRVTEAASEIGIKYLTLYTFSTENWNRPKAEVDALMHLVVTAIERETPDLIKNNVRLTMIGDRSRMPAFTLERLERCMEQTSHCTGLTLVLALSYSSRWEITEAARRMASDAVAGKLDPTTINETTVASYLTTSGMPDPDLLIRTGGDQRISNYLLWQIAYSELFITDIFWPDFDGEQLRNAIAHFQQRERRFGLTSDQLKH